MIRIRLSALIVKELLAAFRDPRARIALMAPPLIQLFLFAFAATLEVSNVPVGVVNEDWGAASEKLISRFEHASAFSDIRRYASQKEAQAAIDNQDVMVVVQSARTSHASWRPASRRMCSWCSTAASPTVHSL